MEHTIEHVAPELSYGTPILYVENDVTVLAQVLQAQKVGYVDLTQPTGVNSREELMIIFLDPNAGKVIMSQADVQNAVKQRFGVREKSATQPNGFIRCTVEQAVPADPQPVEPPTAAEAPAETSHATQQVVEGVGSNPLDDLGHGITGETEEHATA